MSFRHPVRTQRLVSLALIGITLLVMLMPSLPPVRSFAQDAPPPSGDVIVVFKEQPEGTTVAAEAKAATGVQPEQVYSSVIDGFAANVTPEEAKTLANDPQVAGIYPDTPFTTAAQTLPTGVDRIDADTNPSADIDGVDDVRTYTDVAVLDSGIASNTTDLKLMGGTDCTTDGLGYNDDRNGHGTHVAGIIGALDNGRGVVGVAPGARLWSVKVLDAAGNGSMSTLLCGLDWVYAHRGTIDLVNMSIEGPGSDGACTNSPLHEAICNVVNGAGIPVIVAAGNHSTDASQTVPATYNEVITVSAIDDFDGKPGGRSSSPRCSFNRADDTLAEVSNYGPDVDIAAPGMCILSLAPGGGTATKSGTSMAAPHVTGAAALFLAVNRSATPTTPRPLSSAPMMPATCVPWPCSSYHAVESSVVLP
jgi:subtilisin family serine protease